jgi:DNA invertase Pin-like site-specific DNA recombinase
MVDSAMISTATKAESVAIVTDDVEIAPVDVANVPDSIATSIESVRRETGVERAMRREAERKAQADELRGLTVEERRERLRNMRTNGHASTPKSELAQLFDVNPSTITRDLQALGLQ